MKSVNFKIEKNGTEISGTGDLFSQKEDLFSLTRIYFGWKELNVYQEAMNVRRINIPESVSEGIPCMLMNVLRTNAKRIKGLEHSSFDAIDTKNGETYQFKSCSTTLNNSKGSPSSFGPRSEYDHLIYAHFDCETDIVKLYEITENINNIIVNKQKNETFLDQCKQGRRPRFNLLPYTKNLKPFLTYQMKKEN